MKLTNFILSGFEAAAIIISGSKSSDMEFMHNLLWAGVVRHQILGYSVFLGWLPPTIENIFKITGIPPLSAVI